MNVAEEFEAFHSTLLPLDGAKKDATRHADYVVRLLENDSERTPVRSIYSGSFAKHTHIHPIADLDVAVHYHVDDWRTNRGVADPGRVIGAIRSRLDQALGHTAVVRPQRRSIGIVYADVRVDVVPALVEDSESFDAIIPDRKAGAWIKTNVKKHIEFIKGQDRTYRPVAKTIRLMKAWKRAKAVKFPGFALELLTVKALERSGTSANLQNCVASVFDFIHEGQLKRPVAFNANYRIRDVSVAANAPVVIVDPVNESNNVAAEVDVEKRDAFLGKISRDHRNARLAIEAEARGNHRLSVQHWHAVFQHPFASPSRPRKKSFLERFFS